MALAFPSQAAAANPILIVTSSSNPYTTFLPEILRTEGFNEFDTADISVVTTTTLSAYDLVVLGDTSLTAAQVTTFTTWVNGGGNLIAMHPDPQLAGLLGLASSGSTLSNAYMLMNTSAGPGVGLVGQTIQFHGPAELFTLSGATSYATLYSTVTTPTSNPAVTLNQAGSGQAAAFAYDLARSVAYTRQGNPAWSGQARDAANVPPIRAYNLFFGAASFDPEPDWVNLNNVQIPQADEQQRLLANLILQMNTTKKPLPRFWYLPSGYKAAVIMTGDDHGSFYSGSATQNRFSDFLAASPSGCSVANWTCVRATAYLFPNIIASNPLTNSQVSSYVAQGFEIGVHVDSANTCSDWTTTALYTDYTNFLKSLASQFPSLAAPQTHRMHCISWSDYDSQPTIELKHGIRFDTTYYYWPDSWINDQPGMFTGSGMPMRYTDRSGNLINVYQATSQMTDESGQTYPFTINTLLDNALSGSGYYGVFTANMHNDGGSYPGAAPGIVSSAQARGVPVISSLQMLQWLDGRNASSFNSVAWSGNVLSFSITVGTNANNLRAMLPANAGTLGLSGILLNGSATSYQLQTTKGVQYAVFAASAGSYQATYGGSPLFSVSGAVIPGNVASGTTVKATGPVTVTATADNYGNYALNGLPSGTYTITPSKSGAGFAPASQSVTVSGASVAAVNFNMVQTCPCSLWNNNTVPGNPDSSDDSAAIEVGVRFRSDVAGTITAIKFYKGTANTGTHVGNLWTNTGTKLATATFANETASGWQQVNLSPPVAITANTMYVASYHMTKGNYAEDDGYFVNSYDNVPLHGVQDGTSSGNGVYVYGNSAFPTNTFESANFYVDVVFAPAGSFSASGTISGPGGNGATVTLTGTSNATTTADASGNYSFANLANGSYTITATKSGYTFSPGALNVTVNGANLTAQNFTSVAQTYSLSGTISGLGGNAATVNLTGTSTATTTADASGNYTFSGLVNGSYTVTPSNTGFAFSPANLPATINGANVAGINFSTVTYSISGTISGAGGNAATVSLTGTSSATTTADASGNYTFSGLNNGPYTVTPSKSGFTYSPTSQPATVSGGNVTALNFSSTAVPTFTISGTIGGPGGSAATVTLTGTANATTTADASGNYTFNSIVNGSYTVTPSKTGFTYTPASLPATVNNANVTSLNFSTVTYTISGTISGSGGGATVTLSGTASASVTADASGNFTFNGVTNGPYTITPSKSGFGFAPPSQNVTVASANVTGVSFSTTVQTFTLQGTISGTGGSGATVTMSGTSGGTVTADASGNYTFTGLLNGSYTVTPSKTGMTFNPGAQSTSLNGANITGVNFSSFANCPCSLWTSSTVPGNVNSNDPNGVELGVRFTSDVAGVITGIRFYKGSTNTGTHIGNLWTNTGTLLATATFSNETASGWQQVTFATPVVIAANTTYVASYYTPAGNYSYDQNYFTSAFTNTPLHGTQDGTGGSNGLYLYGAASAFPTGTYLSSNYYVDVVFATALTSSISGTISGPGGNGATVNLTGTSTATVTADASGNYTFSGLTNGSYTVTPSNAGFTFTPASQPATVNNGNVTALNFSTVTYSISGTISGTGGNAATVNLTGTSTATVTADASGNYTFSGLNNGSYTVTPSKSGFTFTPATQPATVNSANVTALNFTSASTTTFSISGTISGPGGSAATVNLTGTSTATVTADASGNYTFTGLNNGSYTVTPSKTGFTFTPANQPATVNNANVTALNFSTVTYGISGTISGTGGNAATVNLTGTSTATVTADASGNYTFSGLVNGSYTVTPSNPGFAFSPTSQPVTVNGATVTAVNFSSAVATTFTISGTVSGTGGNGATVALSGTASATVTATATGTYTFSNLANGSYTVTPSEAGYIFTPASTSVTVNGANMTANFTSTAKLAIDKTASTDRSSNATTIVSPAFTTTGTNELLLAFISTDATSSGTNITVSGVTGGSLTWTLVKRTNTQRGTAEIWRAFAPAILTNATVTGTLSQSTAASITVVTFTGADATGTGGSGAIGATGTGNSAKGAPTASLTTTRNNSWVFGVGNDYSKATARTVPSNQTMVHQDVSTANGDTYWVQRMTATTPTSGTAVTINDTAPTGDSFNLSICEVLPAQ